MLAVTEKIWLENLSDLSTNHIRMQEDPCFWLDYHYQDLDINRLNFDSEMRDDWTCSALLTPLHAGRCNPYGSLYQAWNIAPLIQSWT
jgi:hypothetical protein